MADPFEKHAAGLTTPAVTAELITPHDSTNLVRTTRGVSFVTAGDISFEMVDGSTVVVPDGALVAGVIHAIRCTRINATGTGALGIVGWS